MHVKRHVKRHQNDKSIVFFQSLISLYTYIYSYIYSFIYLLYSVFHFTFLKQSQQKGFMLTKV